jgi:hypothetical protein
MKTTIKKTVSKSPAKKAVAKKPMMKMGGVAKKPLRKAQTGTSTGTPFQQYMKTPGAVASDTVMQTMYPKNNWDAPKKPIAKNPKNQGTLEKAYEKTYGQNWRSESGQPASDETFEQYKRRMGPMQKKGGATKTKMAMGGSTKNAKLAALAAPKNKITRADIITGAKRNNKKK